MGSILICTKNTSYKRLKTCALLSLYKKRILRIKSYTVLKPDNNKPFPLRLGELKPILQQQAAEEDRSLHNWIKKILKEHVEKSKKPTPKS